MITEITHFEDQKFFVDEQRFGPMQCGITNTISKLQKMEKVKMNIVNFQTSNGVFGDLLAGFYGK